MVDVGFGDCILVRSPNGKTMLIDSSNNGSNDEGVAAREKIEELFTDLSINSFDLGVYTHAHSDHVNGYTGFLLDNYSFGAFAAPSVRVNNTSTTYTAITDALDAQSFSTYYVNTTTNTSVFSNWDSDVTVDVLWPSKNFSASDWNDTSLVLKMSYGGYSIILTGDATSVAEAEMIALHSEDLLNCDVLKIGHHTSNGATSTAFLNATTPDWAIASFTVSSYGWPGTSTVSRLSDLGLSWSTTQNANGTLFGTSYHGNIHVSISAAGITVETERSYAG